MNDSVNKAKEKMVEAEGKVKECEEILKIAQKELNKAKDTLWDREKDLKDAKEKALAFDDFVSELKTYEEEMTKGFVESKDKPNIFIRVEHWDGHSYGCDFCYYQAFDRRPKGEQPYTWINKSILQKDDCRIKSLEEAIVGNGTLIIVNTGKSVRYTEDFISVNHLIALTIAFFYRDKKEITDAAKNTKEMFGKMYIKEKEFEDYEKLEKSVLKKLYEKLFEPSST